MFSKPPRYNTGMASFGGVVIVGVGTLEKWGKEKM